jgi:YD repeat-containing protein
VYARPLDSNGLPNGEPFVIQESNGNQQNTAVAYSTNGRYQLAWQDDATGPWDLFTATLDRSYQVTHIQYEYDPLYRLVRAEYEGDFNGEYRYAYDAVGNRTAYTTTITSTTVIA